MEAVFKPLWPGGPVYVQSPHFLLGTDSILLADFVRPQSRRHGLDLGCGGGILMLLLKTRLPELCMEGLEILPEAADIARENLRKNFPGEIPCVRTGDLRNCRTYYSAGSFDFLVSNPPYFAAGSGRSAPEAGGRSHAVKQPVRWRISAGPAPIFSRPAGASASSTAPSVSPSFARHSAPFTLNRSGFGLF